MTLPNSPKSSARSARNSPSVGPIGETRSPRKGIPGAGSPLTSGPVRNDGDIQHSARLIPPPSSARSNVSARSSSSAAQLSARAKLSPYAIPLSARSQQPSARIAPSSYGEAGMPMYINEPETPRNHIPSIHEAHPRQVPLPSPRQVLSEISPVASESARNAPLPSPRPPIIESPAPSARSILIPSPRGIPIPSPRDHVSPSEAIIISPRLIPGPRETCADLIADTPATNESVVVLANLSGHLDITESSPRNSAIEPVLSIDEMLVKEGLEEEHSRPEPMELVPEIEEEEEEEENAAMVAVAERIVDSAISSAYFANTTLITSISDDMQITRAEEERNVGAPSPPEPSPTPIDGQLVSAEEAEGLGENLNKALIEASSTPVRNELSLVNLASPSPIAVDVNISKYSSGGSVENVAFIEEQIKEEIASYQAAPMRPVEASKKKKRKGAFSKLCCSGGME